MEAAAAYDHQENGLQRFLWETTTDFNWKCDNNWENKIIQSDRKCDNNWEDKIIQVIIHDFCSVTIFE